jgi:periplasmic divalent cation tolerance protein
MKINLVYMTAGSTEEARKIGHTLLTAKLVACVNIIANMNSIYMWDGEVQDNEETILIAKTTEPLVPDLIEKVKSIHSYDCPCIVSLPVVSGNNAFLNWIVEQVS